MFFWRAIAEAAFEERRTRALNRPDVFNSH
jgi:hypothetical protein